MEVNPASLKDSDLSRFWPGGIDWAQSRLRTLVIVKEIKPAAVLLTGWSLPPLISLILRLQPLKDRKDGTLRAEEEKVVKNNDNVFWRAAERSSYVASLPSHEDTRIFLQRC